MSSAKASAILFRGRWVKYFHIQFWGFGHLQDVIKTHPFQWYWTGGQICHLFCSPNVQRPELTGCKSSVIFNMLRPVKMFDFCRKHFPLQWRHTDPNDVSNDRRLDCLVHCLFRRRSKKTSKLRATGLCEGNSPVTGEFPAQRTGNAENVSIWWSHHAKTFFGMEMIVFRFKFHRRLFLRFWLTTRLKE